MLCQDCKKRETCTGLCARVEKHLDKREVKQHDQTFSEASIYAVDGISDDVYFDILSSVYTEEISEFSFLSPLENKIVSMFHLQRKTYKEIARALSGGRAKVKLNQRSVKYHLARAKAKIVSFYSNREVSGYPQAKRLECF